MFKQLIVLFLVIMLTACQNKTEQAAQAEQQTNIKEAAVNIKLSPVDSIPVEAAYEDAFMQAFLYEHGRMMFGIQNVRLGGKTKGVDKMPFPITKKGNHLKLNIDNKQLYLSNAKNFDYDLADGTYTIYGVLNRSNFISIKKPETVLARDIKIQGNRLAQSKASETVAIVYNVPYGSISNSDAEKVILDFGLVNTDIEPGGNAVKVTIDDVATFEIHEWKAHYIEGLIAGKHTCQLELLNSSGQRIAAPVAHTFTIELPASES